MQDVDNILPFPLLLSRLPINQLDDTISTASVVNACLPKQCSAYIFVERMEVAKQSTSQNRKIILRLPLRQRGFVLLDIPFPIAA